jgi:MFS family permease
MFANHWYAIVFANVLLGINQGLAWSSTVVMKIDLVGQKNRGLAMGLNESAGYLAVGIAAFVTGYVASEYGLRPYPFYIGIVFTALGLTLSFFFVKDTSQMVRIESSQNQSKSHENIFWETTWKNKNLGSITQAGMVNNLNDGMVWGILPLLLASHGFNLVQIGKLVAIYPLVWGLGQLFMGKLADHLNKKKMLYWGMLAQGLALVFLAFTSDFVHITLLLVVLGLGTAAVYPTFLAAISDFVNPAQRAQSIGIFRLWRDLGYAIGAVITGIIADLLNIETSIMLIAIITIMSSLIIRIRMESMMWNSSLRDGRR